MNAQSVAVLVICLRKVWTAGSVIINDILFFTSQ